jgi:hypothetical protein
LNPKKTIFIILEGILLGNLISKDVILVDPKITKDIMQIPPLHNKKSLEFVFDKINFVTRFIPNFAEISKPIEWMIKKYVKFKWTFIEKEDFEISKSLQL